MDEKPEGFLDVLDRMLVMAHGAAVTIRDHSSDAAPEAHALAGHLREMRELVRMRKERKEREALARKAGFDLDSNTDTAGLLVAPASDESVH